MVCSEGALAAPICIPALVPAESEFLRFVCDGGEFIAEQGDRQHQQRDEQLAPRSVRGAHVHAPDHRVHAYERQVAQCLVRACAARVVRRAACGGRVAHGARGTAGQGAGRRGAAPGAHGTAAVRGSGARRALLAPRDRTRPHRRSACSSQTSPTNCEPRIHTWALSRSSCSTSSRV